MCLSGNYTVIIILSHTRHTLPYNTFISREKHLEAKQVVRMHGNETIITSKDGVVHRFYYDHCFWSFDSSHTDHAGQERVYKDVARPLLDRSFEGYNTCLFAYGQVREAEGVED